jgi:hypothetical protein
MKKEKRVRWLYKRRKRRGGNRSAKASVKRGMSSRLGVIRIGVRGPLCQTSEKGGFDDRWVSKIRKVVVQEEEK